jgi:glycogen operon protein
MPNTVSAGDRLRRLVRGDFGVRRGHPLPLGTTLRRDGVNFAVFSRHATDVSLVLFVPGEVEPVLEVPLDSRYNRTGDVWHVLVLGIDPAVEYGWRMDRIPNTQPPIHRFDSRCVLLDPYARGLAGLEGWSQGYEAGRHGRLGLVRSKAIDDDFEWGEEHPLNIPLADSVIYEVHVRGFTAHPSSGVAHPGTFEGLIEKIPHLRELGVTAVELLPVTEFEECDHPYKDPVTGERLCNFWGYQPISFFAPKASYSAAATAAGAVRSFKSMVKALHEAGIEVILDIVFNHSGEGGTNGPTCSFRGLDNETYYLLEPRTGKYLDFSGCGNTVRCNHPVVRSLILTALRYWVTEMHVDGFRFDLASILGRSRDGSVHPDPPLLEIIAGDAVLAHTKLIAEAWDAAGLYQVGSFPSWGRWAEWNGKFRDDVRRFVKSDEGMVGALLTRLSGSPDLYRRDGRAPWHSINFVTSHDGFTLRDLVGFDHKHNERNGEKSRDGLDLNLSWNCGVEGETTDPEVRALRARQARNFMTLLLLAQGVPMILGGDEMLRTQKGNNNAYCQDNDTSWFDWGLRQENADFFRFVTRLVRFRRAHPALRRHLFFEDAGAGAAAFHGPKGGDPDPSPDSRSLGLHLRGGGGHDDLFLVAHAHWEPSAFALPRLRSGRTWRLFLDTAKSPPEDIAEPGEEAPLGRQSSYNLTPRSVAVLVGR